MPQDVYIAGDSTNKDYGVGHDYNSSGVIYHPLGWELDYNFPSNGAGPNDSNADMVFNGWGGPYNLWGPVHYGGEAGNFLFAGLHVDTVRIDVWATSPLMWGSQPSPGGRRTIPGWDYVLYE